MFTFCRLPGVLPAFARRLPGVCPAFAVNVTLKLSIEKSQSASLYANRINRYWRIIMKEITMKPKLMNTEITAGEKEQV